MGHVGEFDYVTINHYFDEALQDIRAVIRSRRLVAAKQLQRYAVLVETLT
jgi:guanylate kinase